MSAIAPETANSASAANAARSANAARAANAARSANAARAANAASAPPSGDVTVAWSRKVIPIYVLLRVVEVVGAVLGHGPGAIKTRNDKFIFTYKSLRTLYIVVLIILVTCAQLYSLVKPKRPLWSLDTAENVAAVTPHYMDVIFFYLIAAFNFCRAESIKMSFSDICQLSKTTAAPSCLKQFLILSLWLAYALIIIARGVLQTIQFLSVQKTAFSFGDFVVPFVGVFIKIYMTWLLEMYILVCLTLRERQEQLRKLMKEVITPQREGFWNLLDVQVIEGIINQHRSFSRQTSRYFETMSPALLVLMASFFVNEAFGLHTFLTRMVFVDGILKLMALIEIGFLLSYFLLVFVVCYVTSSLSDQWCCVGQEVTGVPLCRVTDPIRVQLLTFLQQLPDQAPVVTAAGFFVISKSMLLAMLNFIATYLIFTVQFHDAS